jgi:hypothetical protein
MMTLPVPVVSDWPAAAGHPAGFRNTGAVRCSMLAPGDIQGISKAIDAKRHMETPPDFFILWRNDKQWFD